MIEVQDGRGSYKKGVRKKNLGIVKDWFEKNPGKRVIDCFRDKDITLSYEVVRSCVKELKGK